MFGIRAPTVKLISLLLLAKILITKVISPNQASHLITRGHFAFETLDKWQFGQVEIYKKLEAYLPTKSIYFKLLLTSHNGWPALTQSNF